MTLRRLLAVVAWTLLVLVCSTGVWGVIRTAGTGVTTSPEVPSTITSAAPWPGRATTSPGSYPSTTARTPSSTREATPSPTPAPANPGKPVDPEEADEADDPGAPRSEEPTGVRRTWQGTAGAVVASCRGATITFHGAQPNSGWRVEVGNRGPEEIEVHFSRFQGEQEGTGEVELKAHCAGGQPRFSTSDD